MHRGTSSRGWVTRGTGSSARGSSPRCTKGAFAGGGCTLRHGPGDGSALPATSSEPFARTVALLSRGVQHPLLRAKVRDLCRDAIEPGRRLLQVTDAPPQLAHEVGEHGAFLARDPVEAR